MYPVRVNLRITETISKSSRLGACSSSAVSKARSSAVPATAISASITAELSTLNRLSEPVGFLSIDEMRQVDEALALVLDL